MKYMNFLRFILMMCAALLSLTSFNSGDSEYKMKQVYIYEKIPDLECNIYLIDNQTDSILFCKVDADESLKPVVIWCPASTPQPLVVKQTNSLYSYGCIPNCDWKTLLKDFHLLIVGNPHVPAVVSEDSLNNEWAYITNPAKQHSYPRNYLQDNYMDNYVKRCNQIIDFVRCQNWAGDIYTVGHSQGAKVAIKISAQNDYVKAVGAFSINPLGRVDEFVRRARLQAIEGKITDEEAQRQINQVYDYWQSVCERPMEESVYGEDSHKTTYSFSTPTLSDIVHMKKPVYIAYGTRDVTSSYCDLLPIEFIRKRKTDWKVVPYLNMEHNFAVVKDNGEVDWSDYHFCEVIRDFLAWLKEL